MCVPPAGRFLHSDSYVVLDGDKYLIGLSHSGGEPCGHDSLLGSGGVCLYPRLETVCFLAAQAMCLTRSASKTGVAIN